MNRLKSFLHLPRIIKLTIICTLAIALPVMAEWVVIQEKDLDGRDYMAIAFTGENTGWVVGSALLDDLDNPGFIGYTMNGGKTWQKSDIKLRADLTGIFFLDANHGWAVGANGLIAGTTNGRDWERQICKVDKVLEVNTALKGVYFINKDVGYAVGQNDTIVATKNGGKMWEALQGGKMAANVGDDEASMFNAVQFLDENTGWIAGVRVFPATKSQKSVIQKTTDGALTWQMQETGTEDILEDIFFLDASVGWAVGENGVILHTTNGGKKWQIQKSGTTEILRSVRFVDKYTGWAVGGDFGVGVILTTNSGGKKWEIEESNQKMVSVSVLDKKNAWLAAERGLILKTE